MQARKARERAQASKNPVDADQVLSQLGRLKLDQKSPIETSTQPLDAPSPPASAQEKKEEQKKADEVQKVQKVRGRGNSSFIKHTSDFAD